MGELSVSVKPYWIKTTIFPNFSEANHEILSYTSISEDVTDNIESLIKRVDDALYQAKDSGRNRVVSG